MFISRIKRDHRRYRSFQPVGFLPQRRKLDSYRQDRPLSRAISESVVTLLIVAVLITGVLLIRRHHGLP